ncbi:MAG: cupin domain-containing protein [Actinobacteria bacterium]|nr:cupin domain-containing protein [Actinomycetota bacterium]
MTELSPDVVLARAASEVERVEKPWGYEIVFALTEDYCGKVLVIRKGEQLSLQFHREKDETIYVHEGTIELEIGETGGSMQSVVAGAGQAFRLRPGVVHRWRALEDAVVLESSTPHIDDVVRLEDNYGRAEPRDD